MDFTIPMGGDKTVLAAMDQQNVLGVVLNVPMDIVIKQPFKIRNHCR